MIRNSRRRFLVQSALLGSVAILPTPDGKARAADSSNSILCGIDVLQRDGFKLLAGKRVGLITNHTGINRHGQRTVRLLQRAANVNLVALFSPEHGIAGKLDVARIADAKDPETGLRIFSLYGETRRPTAASLRHVDVLVFDIQDIGARFYTYISTMGYAMEEAGKHNIEFVVLDRPNPIGGVAVDGPVLDADRESFVGYHPIAVRHGMTVGELAAMFRVERKLKVKLTVVKMKGWHRADYFDRTGLLWVNPSPNMRSLTEAVLYPGIGLLETTNLSVGRGTDRPFELIGAPWLDGQRLASRLNHRSLPGIRFVPLRFTPDSSKFAGEQCGGIALIITDWSRFRSIDTGLEIACQLRTLYANQWDFEKYDRLLACKNTWQAVGQGLPLPAIRATFTDKLQEFKHRRQRYLCYH